MFQIEEYSFPTDTYGSKEYVHNWPMLYILENGKLAYVGQTHSIIQRMNQHKDTKSKQQFNKVHIIYSDQFNQSVTFDYESRLISLMAADRKFLLTNRNAGLAGINYYRKDAYDLEFNALWQELQKRNLVVHSIDEIEQSDLFKYSPYKSLTNEQRNIVTEIVDNLRKNLERNIVIRGMPGSGKTIVAVYLMKLLRESPGFKDYRIGMVIPPTSLRATMQAVFKTVNGLSPKDIYGPNDIADGKFDILIVDEAHRLKERKNLSDYKSYDETCKKIGLPNTSTQLDWILKQSKCSVFFCDEGQIVFPAGLDVGHLLNNDPFGQRMLAYYTLYSQMRCKAGTEYLKDLRALLHNQMDHPAVYENYEFSIVKDFSEFQKLYRIKEQKHGLSRMIAGYAWKWESKTDKTAFDIEIEGQQLKWNSVLKNWVHSPNACNEVGCIHSTQGYDLNYGFVILGKDICYDNKKHQVITVRESYYDKYGKQGATDSELDAYIKNIYYVLLSRGVLGTYLYVCDESLREYLEQYIPVI